MKGAQRPYWAAWHASKITLAVSAGVVLIFILSQINFATTQGLESGR